jgi:endoribonuclease Dicer
VHLKSASLRAGAHYDQGGENAAQSMMRWFGRDVGVDPQKRHEARTRKNGQQGLLPASKIVQLEDLLTYKFENKDLLVEALTHASYGPSSRDSYQVQ